MTIWVCYTEVESEPSFIGYTKTKKDALAWVKETVEFRYPNEEMKLDVQENQIMADNGYHHVIAIKLGMVE